MMINQAVNTFWSKSEVGEIEKLLYSNIPTFASSDYTRYSSAGNATLVLGFFSCSGDLIEWHCSGRNASLPVVSSPSP